MGGGCKAGASREWGPRPRSGRGAANRRRQPAPPTHPPRHVHPPAQLLDRAQLRLRLGARRRRAAAAGGFGFVEPHQAGKGLRGGTEKGDEGAGVWQRRRVVGRGRGPWRRGVQQGQDERGAAIRTESGSPLPSCTHHSRPRARMQPSPRPAQQAQQAQRDHSAVTVLLSLGAARRRRHPRSGGSGGMEAAGRTESTHQRKPKAQHKPKPTPISGSSRMDQQEAKKLKNARPKAAHRVALEGVGVAHGRQLCGLGLVGAAAAGLGRRGRLLLQKGVQLLLQLRLQGRGAGRRARKTEPSRTPPKRNKQASKRAVRGQGEHDQSGQKTHVALEHAIVDEPQRRVLKNLGQPACRGARGAGRRTITVQGR